MINPLRLVVLLACTSIASAASSPSTAPVADMWAPFRALLGDWEGTASQDGRTGRSERRYRLVLNARFIEVVNATIYPPQEKQPKGYNHEDRGFIGFDRAKKRFSFRQFHSEGFINHYEAESISADGKTIVFVSVAIENIAPGYRARETYQLVSEDEFIETFALAEPGKDFATYSETRFRRKK